jgi:hypothetical protein
MELVHCESRVAVAEAWRQFENPYEGERQPFEAGTRGLAERQNTEKIQCVR